LSSELRKRGEKPVAEEGFGRAVERQQSGSWRFSDDGDSLPLEARHHRPGCLQVQWIWEARIDGVKVACRMHGRKMDGFGSRRPALTPLTRGRFMRRAQLIAGHVVTSGRNIASCHVGLPLLRSCVAGSNDDSGSDDDEVFEDDELADLLAAQALGDGDDEDSDLLGLDDPTEDELLEQLQTNDPLLANPAVAALRQLWRESEGPFASGDLDDAMSHLRQRVTSPEQALRAINKSVGALKQVAEEYPDWPEPLNELATCELLRANPDESVRVSLRVLGKQPAHFDCLARLALSYAIIGNQAEGDATIDKLEKVCPVLARPLRELVKALSAAVKQAESAARNSGSGEGEGEPEMIQLEIDPETLQSLGPILQGMGGFGDAMEGLGGGAEGVGGEEFADLLQELGDDDANADLMPDDLEDLDDGEILFPEDEDAEGERIPAGAEVALTGLNNFPEYNGVTATNRGFDEERGRYVVELADGRQIAAKPANVQTVDEAWEGSVKPRMERVLEEAEAALEEMEAALDGDGEETKEVLEFEIGGRVELTGLVQAAQHNGKTGVFRGIDEENGRFVVELEEEDGKMLAVKPQNLKSLA
jgi:hypothetical protein